MAASMINVHVVVRALYIIKVYGVYVEQATNVEVDDLKVIADSKINYGGKTFGIDD